HQDLLAHLHELPSDLKPEDGHGIYNVHNLEVPGVFTLKNQYAFDTQSSIKMGKRIIQRRHPDYIPVHFVNTLLGGFFGSRLMQNIREKEGLTYNIYSDLEPMFHDAYFIIGTRSEERRVGKECKHWWVRKSRNAKSLNGR